MNRLDKYGFNWYAPPENVEIVSTINLLNEALLYRFLMLDPNQFPSPSLSIYRAFNSFITRAENIMNSHLCLHPDYIDSTLNLSNRVGRAEELFSYQQNNPQNAFIALTIMEWSDLEDITGEDLTVFKDRSLRTNEVFGVGLLTKMYKVVDAFKYRRIQGTLGLTNLVGRFLGQIAYTRTGTGDTEYTDTGVSSNSLFNSYNQSEIDTIESTNTNAHDEFVNVFGQSKNNEIFLTPQVANGLPYGSPIERPANDFRASKQWLYRLSRRGSEDAAANFYQYDYNDNQRGYYGCLIEPQFGRGNSTDYYSAPTRVFHYGQEQDITDINFYEAFCFYNKSENFDFGTGVSLYDGGTIPYFKNADNTMQTDVFANFSESPSDFPLLDEPPYTSQVINFNSKVMQLESGTFFNLNDTEFNEYKTVSPVN